MSRLKFLVLFAILVSQFPTVSVANDISISGTAINNVVSGRLFVSFTRSADEEPRTLIGEEVSKPLTHPFFAMDVDNWDGTPISFKNTSGYPLQHLNELEPGVWFVQALLHSSTGLSSLDAPGNRYSKIQKIVIKDGEKHTDLSFDLDNTVPEEVLPSDTPLLKFVKIRSQLLSEFYQRDIYLRASVMLPHDFDSNASDKLPVLFETGGLNQEYTRSRKLLKDDEFMEYWRSEKALKAIIVFLDGESPWGDSYQMDSLISGPYATANFQELFPYLSTQFPIDDQAANRFVSGCSTGGWVSLALQVLYPDYFNGAFSFSPDSPTFESFQLINLYKDEQAFVNEYGNLRPSSRSLTGEPMFTIKDEIALESAIGKGDQFTHSAQQWGIWNVIFGTPDEQGKPIPIWDQVSGKIDHKAVDQWRRWDIDQYIKENWQNIGAKLTGKLNFWMGGMDDYYLNVGLKKFEKTLLSQKEPSANANFEWQPNLGHCDFDRSEYFFKVFAMMQNSRIEQPLSKQ